MIDILREAIENPEHLIECYTRVWNEQFTYGENHVQHFYDVRERFNAGEKTPANMLYLLARCVKGSVRYGKVETSTNHLTNGGMELILRHWLRIFTEFRTSERESKFLIERLS